MKYNVLYSDDKLVNAGTMETKTFKSGKTGFSIGMRIEEVRKAVNLAANKRSDWVNFLAFEALPKQKAYEGKHELDDEIPF